MGVEDRSRRRKGTLGERDRHRTFVWPESRLHLTLRVLCKSGVGKGEPEGK